MTSVKRIRKHEDSGCVNSSVKRFKLCSNDGHIEAEGRVSVKSQSDESQHCLITSIASLDAETVACTDWINQKVKLVNIKVAVLRDEISLPMPWDLTCIPGDQVAVTLVTTKQIQLLSFRDHLSKCRSIAVNGACRGIMYKDEKFFVTYEDQTVEILTLVGEVLQCFKTDKYRQTLFQWPLYVAVGSDENLFNVIYVSDAALNSVIKLSIDGEVLQTYVGPSPRQLIACKDGSVLVCSPCNHCVHHIPLGSQAREILMEEKDGVRECWALCVNDNNDMLYLGDNSNNMIQIYKMKRTLKAASRIR